MASTSGENQTWAGTAAAAGSATGVLRGAGRLAGTVVTSSSAAGVLRGVGKLAGTVTVQTTASARITGIGVLVGTASGVATATGVLLGAGLLRGTAACVLTTTGRLADGTPVIPTLQEAYLLQVQARTTTALVVAACVARADVVSVVGGTTRSDHAGIDVALAPAAVAEAWLQRTDRVVL